MPLSVSTHAANHHEVRLVQLCFDFYMIEAKPKTLVGDRAYDSDPLDDELRKDGIEMVAPHRSNRRKRATQDGRRASAICQALVGLNASSPGYNGSVAFLSAGSFIRRTSLASCNSPASSSSSDDFEIGSTIFSLESRNSVNAPLKCVFFAFSSSDSVPLLRLMLWRAFRHNINGALEALPGIVGKFGLLC